MTVRTKVYFYSLFEADELTPHCGLICAKDAEEVKDQISYNFCDPKYVTVRRVHELVGLMDPETGETEIVCL